MTAPLTLAALLAGASSDETLATQIALASIAGFPATSWQAGSVPRTIFELEALAHSDLTRLIAAIASGGFLDFAEGGWLDLCAQQLYNLTRRPAVYTRGPMLLTDNSGSGGVDVTEVGQVWVEAGGLQFRNVSLGSLADGGTLSLTFEAEFPGAAANLPDGTSVTLVTSLPGVSVALDAAPGETWVTQQGVDEESDPGLRERCRARWGELAIGATDLAYKFWTLSAAPEITRVAVAEAVGDGTVSIYAAGPSGDISTPALDAANALVTSKRPQCVRPTVYQATEVGYALAGTIKIKAAQLEAAKAAVAAAVAVYFSTLPLGALIYRAPLEAVILAAHPGVLNVALTNAAETVLTASQVAVASLASVSWVAG